MKFIVLFVFAYLTFAHAQQNIDKLNVNQLKLPKESVSRALLIDATGQVKASSSVTDTELSYLDGLNNTLVNLLNGKANDSDVFKLTGEQSASGVKTFTGKLVASSTVNGSTPCPVMTETQRNAFTPVQGDCVYNSTTLKLNVFDGSVWKDAGGAGGISLWLTANPYNINDIVIESDKIYRCLIAHTSGTFATDLSAGRWVEVSSSPVTPYSLANGGTGKALTAVSGGIVWVDSDSFEVLSAGVSGQVLRSNGASSPSWEARSVPGKSQYDTTQTVEEIQVPNNQLTQTALNRHLIESGNQNILSNPSFEHATFSTGWTTATGGTPTENTVNEVHGLKAYSISLSAALSVRQDTTLYASEFNGSVQGLASIRVKSSNVVTLCARQAGVTSTSLCAPSRGSNTWELLKVPFILSATSNGLNVSTTATSGTVLLDDAFVGAVDLAATVDSSKIAGKSYFAAGSTVASTSYVPYSGNPAPTIEYFALGTWATTSSGGYRQTITNLPAGCYRHEWSASVGGSNIGGNYRICAAVNGSCSLSSQSSEIQPSTAYFPMIASDFTCFSQAQSTVNFEMLGSASVGSQGTLSIPVNFKLTYFNSTNTYSSNNADTDWAPCTPSGYQGIGTPSAVDAQCKRDGGDLLYRGRITTGTPSGSNFQVSLPLWNGVQLVTKNSTVIPSLRVAGNVAVNSTVTQTTTYFVLIQPNVSFFNLGVTQGTNQTPLNAAVGNFFTTSAYTFSFDSRIPIEGWENSNIIIGQFNGLESCQDSYTCTDTFSAKISSSGVVSDENLDFISGNCSVSGSSVYTCTLVNGLRGGGQNLTSGMNCAVSPNADGVGTQYVSVNESGTGLVRFATVFNSATGNRPFSVVCQKAGADYIGKTAKAVASDQNLRTPGVTKSILFSGNVASAGGVTNNKGGIISSGSCSGGVFTITFSQALASAPICTVSYTTANNWRTAPTQIQTSTTGMSFLSGITSQVYQCGDSVAIICHGETL